MRHARHPDNRAALLVRITPGETLPRALSRISLRCPLSFGGQIAHPTRMLGHRDICYNLLRSKGPDDNGSPLSRHRVHVLRDAMMGWLFVVPRFSLPRLAGEARKSECRRTGASGGRGSAALLIG